MTAVEYLEFIEEHMGFPDSGIGYNPDGLFYCTQIQHDALKVAHEEYIQKVEKILFPEGR